MDGNAFATPVVGMGCGTFTNVRLPAHRRKLRSDLAFAAADLLILWDMVTVGAAGCCCALAYRYCLSPALQQDDLLLHTDRLAILGALLSPLVLAQRRCASQTAAATVVRTSRQVAALFSLLLLVGFLTRILDTVPRLWLLSWFAASFVATVGGRLWLIRPVRTMLKRGLLSERVAIVGDGPAAAQLRQHINLQPDSGVRLVAVFGDIAAGDPGSDDALGRLLEMGRQHRVDRVILALPSTAEDRVSGIAHRLRALDVEVALCPSLIGLSGPLVRTTQVAGAPLVVLTPPPIGRWGLVVKGLEDRFLAGMGVVLLAPVLALIALAVRLDSPGPVIFRQRRHGWNGSEFEVLKFRTMAWRSGGGSGEMQTCRGDSRVTRIGSFLRRTSLDELPQLFNVLNGTMSLVGPRPHPVVMRTEQRLGEEIIAEYSHRHRVKPGITGWAQVNGHRGATETAEQVRQRVEHDIAYIETWSLWFDLRILVLTPYRVLFSRQNAF